MQSENNRTMQSGAPSQKEEYELLGHDKYFDKYNRYQGMTREQTEVARREWTPETWARLYKRESNSIDNF